MNKISPRLLETMPMQAGTDLRAIHNLLRVGRNSMQQGGLTHYPHPGDLSWWLFYPPLDPSQVSQVYLWDDPVHSGEILGLVFISANEFTIFLHPALPLEQAAAMRAWASGVCMARARNAGKKRIFSGFISDADRIWTGWYAHNGFEHDPESDYVCFRHTLEAIPGPALPEGFSLTHMGGKDHEKLIASRATAQYGAFQSKADWESYLQRYQRFSHSAVYTPELDRIILSPDGQVAAFCINWLDVETGIGLFEPVGAHPKFLRRGLSKALLSHALAALKEEGMRSAIVLTNWDNQPAIALYHAVGFQDSGRLLLFTKPVEE